MGLRFVLLVVLSGCGHGGGGDAGDEWVLRVSTHEGLEPLTSQPANSGTASMAALVYEEVGAKFQAIRQSGARVELEPRPFVSLDDDLLRSIRHPDGLVPRIEGNRVILALAEGARSDLIGLSSLLLDSGPYLQEEYTPNRIRLRRRKGNGPAFIEILNMPTQEEEWRRLLAREADIVLLASPRSLAQLRQIPSVRVVPVKYPNLISLTYRVRTPPLDQVDLRRGLSLALKRTALAEVAVGDASAAIEAEENVDEARTLLRGVGRQLTLVLHEGMTDLHRAALVIQQQLAQVGVDVALRPIPGEALRSELIAGRFDAWLFYGDYEPIHFNRFVTDGDANVSGFANPTFDAAARVGDLRRAREILESEYPLSILYRANEGVAMDRRLCGDQPQFSHDRSWLATVHRCAPGEGE